MFHKVKQSTIAVCCAPATLHSYVDYELLTFIYSYLPKTVRLQMADKPLVKLGGVIASHILYLYNFEGRSSSH